MSNSCVFGLHVIFVSLVAADDMPPFKITTKRDNDRVDVKVEKGQTIFSVHSPFGISHAVIERTSEKWPDAVVLWLHLKGLENFKITSGKVKLEGSASFQEGKPVVRLWKDGKEDAPLLNLSDLRCPKSGVFFKQFKALEEDHLFDAHSVFSDRRADELTLKLTSGVPVIRAWGVSGNLDPLIDRCLSKLTRAKLVRGLLKEGTTSKFLHPLPSLQSQKVEWINRMVEQCRVK